MVSAVDSKYRDPKDPYETCFNFEVVTIRFRRQDIGKFFVTPPESPVAIRLTPGLPFGGKLGT